MLMDVLILSWTLILDLRGILILDGCDSANASHMDQSYQRMYFNFLLTF